MSDARSLVVLRHGRTSWNAEGRIQGHQDVGLDDLGHAQASRTAPALAALDPVAVWCSDLARTRETVAPLAAATGLEVRFDARLREFGFGATEGLLRSDLEATDPAAAAALRRGDYDRVDGAESTAVVRDRMASALRDLIDLVDPGRTAVAVSHGGSIRVGLAALLGWPDGLFHTLGGLDNCSWAVLQEHPLDGRLRLLAYNRTTGDREAGPDFASTQVVR